MVAAAASTVILLSIHSAAGVGEEEGRAATIAGVMWAGAGGQNVAFEGAAGAAGVIHCYAWPWLKSVDALLFSI